jgi:hypothetical protein
VVGNTDPPHQKKKKKKKKPDSYLKNTNTKKSWQSGSSGRALPSKCDALSSNPKKKEKKLDVFAQNRRMVVQASLGKNQVPIFNIIREQKGLEG